MKRSRSSDDDFCANAVGPLDFPLSDENLASIPAPKKTFDVEPFVHIPKLDSSKYLDDAWRLLQPEIKNIFQDEYEGASFNFIQIFRAVEHAFLTNVGWQLYCRICVEFESFICEDMQSLKKQSSASDPSVFLPLVEKCYLDFKGKMKLLSDLTIYNPCDGKALFDMGKEVYLKHLSLASEVEEKVIAGILALINDQRSGKAADMSLLRNLMDMFDAELPSDFKKWISDPTSQYVPEIPVQALNDLLKNFHGKSKSVVEKRFIDSTGEFYAAKSLQVLQKGDLSQYMKFVEGVLREERKIWDESYYLFVKCWRQLRNVVNKQLLEVHTHAFKKGFTEFMEKERLDDLRRMFGLFSRAGMVGNINDFLKSYICDKGRHGSLLELKSSIDRVWYQCFNGDLSLDKSIRASFESLGMTLPITKEIETTVRSISKQISLVTPNQFTKQPAPAAQSTTKRPQSPTKSEDSSNSKKSSKKNKLKQILAALSQEMETSDDEDEVMQSKDDTQPNDPFGGPLGQDPFELDFV